MINNLRAKILISMDILASKDINLILTNRSGHVNSYQIKFDLVITPLLRPFVRQEVMFKKPISVSAKSHMAIPIECGNLPSNDYMFEPANGYSVTLFTILVDLSCHAILVRNNSDQPIHLPNRL